MIPISVLDLAPITVGGSVAASLANSVDLAQHAERWGFNRFWMAEHHGMPGIASAATAVLLGHVAGATKTIRVGAGGVMLPNHAPLTNTVRHQLRRRVAIACNGAASLRRYVVQFLTGF